MPISVSRVIAEGASLVCSVESTRWPVSAASMAIVPVSLSRISPIMTLSGSCRRIERSAAANVSPAFSCTCTCESPASRYSTGSSTVMRLVLGSFVSLMAAYSVVDLPEPVGPVTRMAAVRQRRARPAAARSGCSRKPEVLERHHDRVAAQQSDDRRSRPAPSAAPRRGSRPPCRRARRRTGRPAGCASRRCPCPHVILSAADELAVQLLRAA